MSGITLNNVITHSLRQCSTGQQDLIEGYQVKERCT